MGQEEDGPIHACQRIAQRKHACPSQTRSTRARPSPPPNAPVVVDPRHVVLLDEALVLVQHALDPPDRHRGGRGARDEAQGAPVPPEELVGLSDGLHRSWLAGCLSPVSH